MDSKGFFCKDEKMGKAQKQAAIASLKELIAQMQGKMAEGEGEEEMTADALSEAVEEATETASNEEQEGEEGEDEAAAMQEDMKNMLSGRPKAPSRAKMRVMALEVKKPGKKIVKV